MDTFTPQQKIDLEKLEKALFSDLRAICDDASPGDLQAHVKQINENYPGGFDAYNIEWATRNHIMVSMQHHRFGGMLSDNLFEALLVRLATPQGRLDYLKELQNAFYERVAEKHDSDLRREHAQQYPEPAPAFTVSASDANLLLTGKATGPGPMVQEFLNLPDTKEKGIQLKYARIYEFEWGFVVEQSGIFDFYVAAVWRQGTSNYYDRFISAWYNDCDSEVEQMRQSSGGDFYISFDDGISNHSCLSLGNLHGGLAVRKWIAEFFLSKHFPVFVAKALNPQYKFLRDWHCT